MEPNIFYFRPGLVTEVTNSQVPWMGEVSRETVIKAESLVRLRFSKVSFSYLQMLIIHMTQ